MKKTTTIAAAAVLVSLGGVAATTMESDVTSPHRTVIQAAPSEPCPYPKARCAPIPPAPMTRLDVDVPEVPMDDVAAEYTAAWEEVK